MELKFESKEELEFAILAIAHDSSGGMLGTNEIPTLAFVDAIEKAADVMMAAHEKWLQMYPDAKERNLGSQAFTVSLLVKLIALHEAIQSEVKQ